MSNIAFLSAAHIHTRGFLESIAKKEDCRAAVIWDDMAERGQRYADEYGAEYSGEGGFPLALSGIACVEEWFDEDVDGYRIEVDVRNPLLGKLFGYVGRFQVETVEVCREAIPNHVKPLREESRE